VKLITACQKFNILIFDNYENHNLLKEDYLDYLENHPDIQQKQTYVQATMTHWFLHKETLQLNLFQNFAYDCIRRSFCPQDLPEYVNMRMNSIWGNIYRKGDYAKSHDHNPSKFSFVYFLKSKPNFSPLCFENDSNHGNELISVDALEGRFVVFPGYIHHSVPIHTYEETRITISGNFY
jgi:hypothetical protein